MEGNDANGNSSVTNDIESVDNTQSIENTDTNQNPVEPKRNIKKLKLKVDGEEFDEEIDMDDDAGLARKLQIAKAAQKRMNEAAMTRKQAEDFIRLLQTDPLKVLNNPKLGLNFRHLAEQFLAGEIQNEMLTPEEKYRKEMEQKLKTFEDEKRQSEEQKQAQQMRELQNHYADDFQKKIITALDAGGVPKNPKTVKRMAYYMHQNIQNGFDIDVEQLVEFVKNDYVSEMKELFGSADGDILLKLLGDDIANKIRKTDLARLKTPSPNSRPQNKPVNNQSQKPDVPMSVDDYMEIARKRARE